MLARVLGLLLAGGGSGEDRLDLDTRRRVFEAVRDYPGSHLSELARTADLDPDHARYHLDKLVDANLVTQHRDGGYLRYFPRSTDDVDRDLHGAEAKRQLAVLRQEVPLLVVLVLLDAEGPLPLQHLSDRAGRSASTLSYHLDKLVDADLVDRLGASTADRRYGLVDAERTTGLLLENPPRPDMVDDFIDLWDGLAAE